MIITLKTLQQKTFRVEVEESITVLDLKKEIEEQLGSEFPVPALKLIYAGKILNDTQPLSDYKIQESNFVVVMVSKSKVPQAKPPEKQETTTSGESSATAQQTSTSETTQPQAQADQQDNDATPSTTTTSTTTTTAAPVTASTESTSVVTTTPTTAGTDTATMTTSPPVAAPTATTEGVVEGGEDWMPSSSVLVTGAEYDEAVANLMALGYERDLVIQALHAAYNNPERAGEYLLSGAIPRGEAGGSEGGGDEAMSVSSGAPQPVPPSSVSSQPQPSPLPTAQQPPVTAATGGQSRPHQGEDSPLSFLRRMPQFQTLRGIVQEHPEMLQGLLQQIGQSNPQLLQVIQANQQDFIDIINEPASAVPQPSMSNVPTRPPPQVGGEPMGQPPRGAAGGQGPPPPAAGAGDAGSSMFGMPLAIQVSPQEKEAIERLMQLGFPEGLVVQAYFACDKNEELTAEFLLQEKDDD